MTWSSDGTAKLWDSSGSLVFEMAHESYVSGAVFNKDATRMLTWSMDGKAKLYYTPKALYNMLDTTSNVAKFTDEELGLR